MGQHCRSAVAVCRAAAVASAAADLRGRCMQRQVNSILEVGRRKEVSTSIFALSSAMSAACTSLSPTSFFSPPPPPPSAAAFPAGAAGDSAAADCTFSFAAAAAVTATASSRTLHPVATSPFASLFFPSSSSSRMSSSSSRSLRRDSSFAAFLGASGKHASRSFSTNRWQKFKEAGDDFVLLPRNCNQALGIAEYALAFLHPPPSSSPSQGKRAGEGGGEERDKEREEEEEEERIAEEVFEKTQLFHIDSVLCGISALALQTNAPTRLREEALDCSSGTRDRGACVFGSKKRCLTEKVVAANCAAVREWDANGTVFGFNKNRGEHRAGEFGHNDFYPVVIAAAQASTKRSIDGKAALKAMICLDEIRGRLAEVFSLKTFKIDHVVYGAIASAAVYGALMGASAEEIESAIGMYVSHYIPWRALRAGEQLSDSKGASAALSAEAAALCVKRSMEGFRGPQDIFRNPEALFRWNKKTNGDAPFDLILAKSGSDFSVCGMHFKIGLYEHQAAGALQGLLQLLLRHPEVCRHLEKIEEITVTAYEPAVGIIGDPAKRNPRTRQSADHSMVYIIATVLRKAAELMQQHQQEQQQQKFASLDDAWCSLMLSPYDYSRDAIFNNTTRAVMEKIRFQHGGEEYDQKYPEGIPSRVTIQLTDGSTYDSGFVMFPPGHAGNKTAHLKKLLKEKFSMLSSIALTPSEAHAFLEKLERMQHLSNSDLQTLYYCKNLKKHSPID